MAFPAVLTAPQQDPDSLHPYAGSWIADGLLPALSSASGERMIFVSPLAGPVTADGSPGDPFNPTSAAASFFGDPIAQALDSIPAPTNSDEEDATNCIIIEGGNYPNPAFFDTGPSGFTNARQLLFIPRGQCVFPAGSSIFREVVPATFAPALVPAFAILAGLGIMFITATVAAADGNNGIDHTVGFHGVQITGIITPPIAGQTGIVVWDLRNGSLSGSAAFAGPALLDKPTNWTFGGAVSSVTVGSPERCEFGAGVAVTALSGDPWRDCDFTGGGIVFSGPAGAAFFDRFTASSFGNAVVNSFAGGATAADYFDRDTEVLSLVFSITPGGSQTFDFACPENRVLTRVSLRSDDVAAGAGTSQLDVVVDGNTVVNNFNLMGMVNGVLSVAGFTGPAGDRDLEEGSLIEVTETSGAGATNGTDIRAQLFLQRDQRELT